MKSEGKIRAAARRARREFSDEFKAEAVRLAAERRAAGGSLTQVGRELVVSLPRSRERLEPPRTAVTTRAWRAL